MAVPARKVFNFTYVLYEEGNKISKLLAAVTLTPVLVAFGLGTAFVVTRRIAWAWTLAGVLFVDLFCRILKAVIDQPRPAGSYREGPGMPSEHAAFSMFLAVHCSMWVICRFKCHVLIKAVACLSIFCWAAAVTFSRHHLGVHSIAQLGVGTSIGVFSGFLSFSLEQRLEAPSLVKVQKWIDEFWTSLSIEVRDYKADAKHD
eukprot:TRINITY_DN7953_c0_g1_i1.p1 TRINITY_DN7953_c0_g1~~TRINITY_DN7953_c0_g1_i1.p1  ORF type:complete len:202 (-),score=22.51 TRINITY_DN7953_c0_g1_i1:187-792(-)